MSGKMEAEESAATAKSNARRALGLNGEATQAAADRASDADLLKLCQEIEEMKGKAEKRKTSGADRSSLSTLSFAAYEKGTDKVILVACQKGAKLDEAQLPTKFERYAKYRVEQVSEGMAASGLHAEMMILRALMMDGIVDPQDVAGSAAAINLRVVCPGKQVCPDCSGWLRSKKIPHYPVEAGPASPSWVHPRTGACFRATKHGINFYCKIMGKDMRIEGSPVTSGSKVGALHPVAAKKG